jgi:CubicO group peptidase (beta-lactamase class C family)
MVMRRGDFTWLGHSGGVAGYTAMMYFDREHQLGVIVLRNATGGRARIGRLAPDMLRTLIDARLAAARPAGGGG